ncbi:MAG: translocation/assembly module TamB domain-containing protein [Adhaeribacter sp.]
MTTDQTPAKKSTGRTVLKVLLWIIGIPLLLVLLVIIALQFTATQNFLADKGTAWLSDKLKTEVKIGRVKTDFRNSFVLEDFYMEDQQQDTLLYAGRLGLDINFFSLLNSEINISSVSLRNATAHIKTFMPDSTTNYDFVLNAFATDTATAQPVDTTAAPFTYNIGDIELENIFFTMTDQIYGNNVRSRIGTLKASMNELNLEKEIYRLNDINLKNSYANIVQTKAAPPDTTEAKPLTMQFGMGKVTLENIKLNYQNTVALQRILLNVGRTELDPGNIDIPNAKVDLNSFTLRNTSAAYFQDKYAPDDSLAINPARIAENLDEAVEKKEGEPVNWVMSLKNLDVAGLNVQFGNYNTPELKRGMDFNHLDLSNITLNADNIYYSVDRMAADLNKMSLKEKSGFQVKNFTADITVDSTQAQLANLNLETGESIIRRHLAIGYPSLATIADNINRLTINADMANSKIGFRDLLYFQPALADNPSFRSILNKPLYVDGRVTGRVDNLRIERLQMAGLNGTAVNASGTITGLPEVDKTRLNLDINRFTVARADVMAFLPPGTLPAGYRIPERITASGGINGGMENLELQNLRVTAAPGTNLQASGTIRNLTNPDNLYANLRIQNFSTTRRDIQNLLPKDLIPANIQLPDRMALKGGFTGSLENFTATPVITTSFGNATANLRMQPGERYNGTVSLDGLDLGKIMKDTTMGKLTADARVNGTGLTPETMRADIDATVQSVFYNNYTYNNIAIKGTADRNLFNGTVNMKDNNLAFNFDGAVNMRNAEPSYNFTLNLDEANLQALNFYGQPLRLQGKVVADMRGASLNTLNGTLDAGQLAIRQGPKTYRLDSLFVRMANQVGRTDITLRSDLMNGFFRGENSAEDLATAFSKKIDSYFNIQDEPFPANINLADFNFDFRFRRTDLLTSGLIPELKKFGPGVLSGSYTQNNQNLQVNGYLPRIVYTTYNLDSLQIRLNGDANKLDYAVTLNEISDTTLLVKNLKMGGYAQDDNLKVRLAIAEDNGKDRFALGGLLNSLQNAYQFKFTPGDVVFNGEPWNVTPDNYLQYYNNGSIYANNIRLEQGGNSLAITSLGASRTNAPLQITFGNFDLANISRAIERNDSLLNGSINGNITLRDITTKLGFTSDLTVKNFAFQKNLIGDIGLQASTAPGDRYNVLATLAGNGNNLTVNGYYIAQTTDNALNLTADITNINLAAFQGFTMGQLEDMSGSLVGRLNITGSLAQPNIRGQATFANATFVPTMLGAPFRLANETMTFDERGINFSNFTLLDSVNNKAVVNGTVFTRDYLNYRFALDVTTNNFVVMNSTAEDNELYYGKLILDTNAKIAGEENHPEITGRIKVIDGSAMTMVIPSSAAGMVEHEGITQFVDMSDTLAARLAELQKRDTLTQTGLLGYNISAVIDVSDDIPFTVIMDQATGDFIEIRGRGELNTGMDDDGNISLSGRYTVSSGKYQLNFYGLAQREFNIARGSSITWAGDPLVADLDIKAIYNVKTAPTELIEAQLESELARNQSRNQLPFEVLINLKGDMLKPDISFDVELPENERRTEFGNLAYNRLQQIRQDPSEVNRQAFSLIVLGRFMGTDPLQSAGGGSLAATARSSVSSLLSDQLNKLTGQYLGGLGLELGLNSYQDFSETGSGQNRTDLNVALNQEFLNNRLVVRVGTDVGIEGRGPQSGNGGFAGNLSVEYLITPNGRLRVRGFKQNSYEDLAETEVQETGLALIFTRNFDNLSDMFKNLGKSRRGNNRNKNEIEPLVQN